MKAMVLEGVGQPLILRDVARPIPKPNEVLIQIKACGVCRTDLHIADGELPPPKLPLIPGHQIVGVIAKLGKNVTTFKIGDRVGVPWLSHTCQNCEFCLSQRENLCDHPSFTGYTQNGGYAEFCTAHEDYLVKIPPRYDDIHAAPLLCAGLIGYRAFRLAGQVRSIGFYGFGSSAHILIQVATALNCDVYVFTRPDDTETQNFALSLKAKWAGNSDEIPPIFLDAAILFAPVGELYPLALKAIKKGGKVISAGIHMSNIPSFPYRLLWEERSISSVANLTRQDGNDFMKLAEQIPLHIKVTQFSLENANQALTSIRDGSLEGSAVIHTQEV